MKKVAFYTLGCKVNQYETEAISGIFRQQGYQMVDFEEKADVYIINTCTVTGLSARKSRQIIRRAKKNNENSIIAVIGCYAQMSPEEIKNIPGVNIVIGTKERGKIIDYINEIESGKDRICAVGDIMSARDFEELKVDTHGKRTRAFLKIQEGCTQFCSYCIIPYARGPVRSRAVEDVLKEAERMADMGFKEIVLTGIHLASYGRDIENTSLINIIGELNKLEGIKRVRLGSIEPGTITQGFIEKAANQEKLCPHYHVSLQSGCDETLKRMNRKYTAKEYRKVIKMLRDNIKDVAVTTDVMVGFPGETDSEFNETYKFLSELSFAKMHIFKYSPRKGTPAASFENQIPPEIKEERSSLLMKLSHQNNIKFYKQYIGRILPVLFEQDDKINKGFVEGLTENYIKVISKQDNNVKGSILNVKLNEIIEDYIIGDIVNKE